MARSSECNNKDLLVDDHSWAIRYLIVDTSNWWGAHDVLVAPQWLTPSRQHGRRARALS